MELNNINSLKEISLIYLKNLKKKRNKSLKDIYFYLLSDIIINYDYYCKTNNNKNYYEKRNIFFSIKNKRSFEEDRKELGNIKERNFNIQYAQEFFKGILENKNLEELKESLIKLNPNSISYLVDYTYEDGRVRNTLYGNRIHYSLDKIIEEITENLNSRRTFIPILEKEDNDLLKPIRENKTTIEYPCAIGFSITLREKKENEYDYIFDVIMRSNDLTLTILYDLYNFTSLYDVIFEKLKVKMKEKYKNIKINKKLYSHYILSGHIFENHLSLIEKILKSNINEYIK